MVPLPPQEELKNGERILNVEQVITTSENPEMVKKGKEIHIDIKSLHGGKKLSTQGKIFTIPENEWDRDENIVYVYVYQNNQLIDDIEVNLNVPKYKLIFKGFIEM